MIRERKIWNEIYKGMNIEVVKFETPFFDDNPKKFWCGYIYLNSKNHPEIASFEVDYREYTDGVPFFDELPFHGGVTFSEVSKHREILRMKIGCDYQHYWDWDLEYTAEDVMREMREVVDAYREKFPEKVEK